MDELKILKEEMEKLSGREITDEALNASIDLYNETRALIRELFSLTKGEHPLVSGTETLQWTIKAMSMPKEIYNQELKAFIEEAKGREPITGYGARLMMIGSAVDDPDYVHIFEEHGGLIVTDYNCYGTRYLWQDVTRKEGETPLESIARSYLEKLTCRGCPTCTTRCTRICCAWPRNSTWTASSTSASRTAACGAARACSSTTGLKRTAIRC